jgi:hypothetical protein
MVLRANTLLLMLEAHRHSSGKRLHIAALEQRKADIRLQLDTARALRSN